MIASEAAYAAGLIDGEGCLSLAYHHNKMGSNVNSSIEVTNRNRECLEFLLERFGGSILELHPKMVNASPAFKWVLWGREAITRVLITIRPYSIVKRVQIEVILDYFDECPPTQGRKVTEEEQAVREEYVSRIRELNRKGVKAI